MPELLPLTKSPTAGDDKRYAAGIGIPNSSTKKSGKTKSKTGNKNKKNLEQKNYGNVGKDGSEH